MNPKKQERGVSDMDVLNDIRGLLSVTHEKKVAPDAKVPADSGLQDKIARLEAELKDYKTTVQKLQAELDKVKADNGELAAKLKSVTPEKPAVAFMGAASLRMDVEGLESRVAELTAAVESIEGELQVKSQELLKKIARLFAEGGQGEAALEFRRGASQLESAENFAHFLRALLNE